MAGDQQDKDHRDLTLVVRSGLIRLFHAMIVSSEERCFASVMLLKSNQKAAGGSSSDCFVRPKWRLGSTG